jgi:hypothetical protein
MKYRAWVVVTLMAGCGDDGAAPADAAPADAPWMCPMPAPGAPLGPGQHVFYLNFEGQALQPGLDDASLNTTPLIQNAVTVPRFFDTVMGDRTQPIATIVSLVKSVLAPYSVDVVTTRPASGDYWMSVIGGSSQAIIGNPNVGSLAPGRCENNNPRSMSLVFDAGVIPYEDYAWSILSDFGAMLGLAVTNISGDCMCRVGGCTHGNQPVCSYGMDVAVDPSSTCGITTQNEVKHLALELGCR